MKVSKIRIHNFKRFDDLEVDFTNKSIGQISNRFLVLGDNGMGKTTLLQAIALPIAIATRQIHSVVDFDWVGFVPGRYRNWGMPRIEVWVCFDQDEIDATREAAQHWRDLSPAVVWQNRPFILPGKNREVHLVLDGENCYAGSPEEYFQFHGRYYVQQMMKTDKSARQYFSRLPGIFWFDQFRNLGSRPAWSLDNGEGKDESDKYGRVAYDFGVERLRSYLNGWKLAQQTSKVYSQDYLTELEKLYKRVFPGRSFAGVEMMPGIDSPTTSDFYFLLNDGHRTYDLVEMSAGEQSVFPVLYEFVRLHIANSIVLIDEVDLNLHPSSAQLLVSQLPKITPSNQFILTSHSEAVNDIISDDETFRLQGGALCL